MGSCECWKCLDSLVTIPPAGEHTPVCEFTAVLHIGRKHFTLYISNTWALSLSHTHTNTCKHTHTHTFQSCQWQGRPTQRSPWCWSHQLPTAPGWRQSCSHSDWLKTNKRSKSTIIYVCWWKICRSSFFKSADEWKKEEKHSPKALAIAMLSSRPMKGITASPPPKLCTKQKGDQLRSTSRRREPH